MTSSLEQLSPDVEVRRRCSLAGSRAALRFCWFESSCDRSSKAGDKRLFTPVLLDSDEEVITTVLLLVKIIDDCWSSLGLGLVVDVLLTSPRRVTLGETAIAAVTSGSNLTPLVVAGIRKQFISRAEIAEALPDDTERPEPRDVVALTGLGMVVGDNDRDVALVVDACVGFM